MIDAEAGTNRTQFMLNATREAISRRQRERLDTEVSFLLLEDVDRDLAITEDFAHTTDDGLD
jgi:uncharacterized protein (DUF1778 family)